MRELIACAIEQEQGITLPETWKAGDPLPPDAMEILRKKFKFPEKRAPLYDDEVVDDVEGLRKRRKLGSSDDDTADESGTATGNETGSGKDDDSDSDSDSSDSDSDKDTVQKISLSLSSDDDSDDDSD